MKKLLLSIVAFMLPCIAGQLCAQQRQLTLTDTEFVVNKWWDGTHNNTVDATGKVLTIHGCPGGDAAREYFGGQAGWVFGTPIPVSDYDRLVVRLKNEGPAVLQLRVRQDDIDAETNHDFAVSTDYQTYEFDLSAIYKNNDKTQAQITTINSIYFWGYWGGGNTVTIDNIYLEKTETDPCASVFTDRYFPLTAEQFNINIWNPDDNKHNAFNEATKELTLGNYNAAGWTYDSGKDFSAYKYLIAVLNQPQSVGLEFRMYDVNGYFNTCMVQAFGEAQHLTLELASLQKNSDASNVTDLNSSSIYIATFWSFAGTSSLGNVFLSNVEPSWDAPITRTTQEGNWGTICLPHAAVCTNGLVYTIAGKSADGATLYLATYNEVMRPGVPYLFKSLGDGVKFYQIEDETIKATTPSSLNGLTGAWTTQTAKEGAYVLNKDNKWYKMDKELNFVNHAYIDLADVPVIEATAAEANIAMDFLPHITAIQTTQEQPAEDDAVYTLSGTRVEDGATLNKGIYIRGGKKFIVK